jgi:hypothetical protein
VGGAAERGEEAEADYPRWPPAASPRARGTLGTDSQGSSVVVPAIFRMEASTAQIVTERLREEEVVDPRPLRGAPPTARREEEEGEVVEEEGLQGLGTQDFLLLLLPAHHPTMITRRRVMRGTLTTRMVTRRGRVTRTTTFLEILGVTRTMVVIE